ncbi:hypothetical protein FJY63_02225, partial [Candidatus Sumerlaeota bacterium]|nr:hypothetical protein [Candidatus Sumerlaeota bacterium]
MIERRDFVRSLLLATGMVLAALIAAEGPALFAILASLGKIQPPEPESKIPAGALVMAGAKIVLFHVLLGLALGCLLYWAAKILASERDHEGKWIVPKRRYYTIFLTGIAVVVAYIHLHAMLIYPALFVSSWRWSALAGSPPVVASVGIGGKIALAVVLLAMLHKRRDEVAAWIRRRANWRSAATIALIVVAALAFAARHYWPTHRGSGNRGPNIIFLGID